MQKTLAILCLSILLASCGLRNSEDMPDGTTGEGHQAAKCSALHGDEQDYCYQEWAVEKGDAKICELINSERFILEKVQPPGNKCFSMVAVELCDPNVCDLIGEGDEFFSSIKCMQRISRKCP